MYLISILHIQLTNLTHGTENVFNMSMILERVILWGSKSILHPSSRKYTNSVSFQVMLSFLENHFLSFPFLFHFSGIVHCSQSLFFIVPVDIIWTASMLVVEESHNQTGSAVPTQAGSFCLPVNHTCFFLF